jgi:hypothetical protein
LSILSAEIRDEPPRRRSASSRVPDELDRAGLDEPGAQPSELASGVLAGVVHRRDLRLDVAPIEARSHISGARRIDREERHMSQEAKLG